MQLDIYNNSWISLETMDGKTAKTGIRDCIAQARIPTRYQGYETVRVICLPEGAVIQDDKKWCTDMVYRHSITMPEYIYEKIVEGDEADDKTLPVWIRGYHMVKDQDCLWGVNHIFVLGLKK